MVIYYSSSRLVLTEVLRRILKLNFTAQCKMTSRSQIGKIKDSQIYSFFLGLSQNIGTTAARTPSCCYVVQVNFKTRAQNHCFIAYIINVGCKSQLCIRSTI